MDDSSVFEFLRGYWSQIGAVLYIVWWSRKIDLRIKDHCERLDRHDHRISASEASNHQHEIRAARTEEILASMKLTLDRIYARIEDRDRPVPPR